jgi:C4-dicarboxylate transporter/malic acid transport protein
MALTLRTTAPVAEHAVPTGPRSGFLVELGGQPPFGHITPNWFASVMGTGIVADAAATLPAHVPGLLEAARAVWVLDLLLLLVVTTATGVHWARHPDRARAYLADPVMSHFYGAPAMALLTVGAGAVLVGRPVVGDGAALALDAVLWSAGTVLGLWTAVAVPYRAFTDHDVRPDSAFGGWLMPVVPPMVSAATGTLLIPHLPVGEAQTTLLAVCYAMFGLTLLASLVMITLIWNRLVQHKVGAAAAVPTLWIVLGPLGQSITASHNLGEAAPGLLPAPYGTAFHALGLVYGLPVWGFAMLWAALALAVTVRTARTGLPFSLTWWSFTFPVGTVVTGTSALAAATGLHLFVVLAVVFYAALVAAWLVVGARTLRGTYRGRLLRTV